MDTQIAAITATLEEIAHRRESRLLLVQGEPGAGKTRLLQTASGLARKAGFSVVTGVTAVGPVPGVAAEPAGLSQHLRSGSSPPSRPDPLLSLGARLHQALKTGGPVLVVADDLHLAETPTLVALRELIARLPERGIVWLLAFGGDPGQSRQRTDLFLGRLRGQHMLNLAGLTGEPLRQLVADHLGAAPDPAVVALAEDIGGNPRAVIELMRGLVEAGDVHIAAGRARLVVSGLQPAHSGRIRVPAPVPERFAAIVRQHLRSLAPFTVNALKLASILGSPFAPVDLAVMLDSSPAQLLPALDEAFSRGLLVCLSNEFAFRSDSIWRVILDSIPQPMVTLLHKQAATGLLSQPGGVEAAALHLAHVAVPGDAEAVGIISDAARRLLLSDPATAGSLASRGLELLQPEQDGHIRLALTAVEALVRARELASAVTMAEESIEQLTNLGGDLLHSNSQDIAALRSWLSIALLFQGKVREAGRIASEALAGCADVPDQRDRPELVRLAADFLTDDGQACKRAEEILSSSVRTAVTEGALTVRAWERWRDGQVEEAMELLSDASDASGGPGHLQLLDPQWMLAAAATRLGQLDKAAVVAQSAARKLPQPHATAVAAALLAPVYLARGQFTEAERSARTGLEGLGGQCLPLLAPPAWRARALVALRCTSLTEAEEHVRALEHQFPAGSSRPWQPMYSLLSAQVAHAKHGACAAIDILAESLTDAGSWRELILEDPTAAACWVRWALEAGATDIAKTVVENARTLHSGNPHVHVLRAGLQHAEGLLAGDPDALAEAGREHPDPWARAMAAEDRGRLLLARDDRETAIVELGKVLTTYSAMGGERESARIRADLRQLGVRRRHWKHATRPVSGWDSLTGAERRVAEFAARGLTNREVANQLFVSPHTVGFHLRQVYRKLDLRSRKQLIRYMSSP